ncbi:MULTISPECIES: N-acetylglucosamine-6-phosphate deacetylase [unclassified Bacillus (in: firmicutes)]|uniref:N-acetylglucosamine-6-phosphate deacetylase n=1 Tax=unclassified Bacillus (in: firmicutes) TaxID=185979 RepID=UPI0008DED130|nr:MULTISPECIES: N-acetylglucosamine-6-phosphate deacetylase [unclassified Bacillus (in: firmicutes)]SFB22034.1 N-acetylglucosamine 6-phosphate deacetylase [Bacillus sp. UNCCL13]SFQ91078.1 N-acetylglucosamine 6-phosphate deacetylase [Bacillus sp. cl95]
MKLLVLAYGKVVLENETVQSTYIYIEDEKIIHIGPLETASVLYPTLSPIVIPAEQTVVPGFIDIHIHGAGGADTMDANLQALETMAIVLPAEGTTSFLATTMTQSKEKIEHALVNTADYAEHHNMPGKAEMLGVHLEGPFINEERAGAQPKGHILDPDIELFKRWQQLSNGGIKLVTVAPEKEHGMSLIRYFRQNGVIASIGHSNAVYDEVKAAVEAGATQVTHLFNGMRGMHHREPGVAGAALLFKELMVELIADGIHINPEMLKLSLNAKGTDGMLLITDSMRAKCLKNGLYDLSGQEVTVADGKALLADGTLAGSILKMNDAIKNMVEFSDRSLREVVKMASENPAKQLQIFDRKGSIAVNKDADFTVLDENFQVVMTFCRGQLAYRRGDN